MAGVRTPVRTPPIGVLRTPVSEEEEPIGEPLLLNEFEFDGVATIATSYNPDTSQDWRITFEAYFDSTPGTGVFDLVRSPSGTNFYIRSRPDQDPVDTRITQNGMGQTKVVGYEEYRTRLCFYDLLWDASEGDFVFQVTPEGFAEPFEETFTPGAVTDPGNLEIFAAISSGQKVVIQNFKVFVGEGATMPTHYWPIDEGSGTNIVDYGSAGADATLTIDTGTWRARATPPILAAVDDVDGTEEEEVSISLSGTDVSGRDITITVENAPEFLVYTEDTSSGGSVTGTLAGTPAVGEAGTYSDIQVVLSQDDPPVRSVSDLFTLTVAAAENTAPALDQIDNQSQREGDTTVTVNINATDLDGDTITLSAFDVTSGSELALNTNIPATLTPTGSGTGFIEIDAGTGDAGVYTFRVRATDDGVGALTDEKDFTVTVTANTSPVLTLPAAATAFHGDEQVVNFSATDADGDSVTFTKTSGPDWIGLTSNVDNTGFLTIDATPDIADGDYEVVVRATDDAPVPAFVEGTITVTLTRSAEFQETDGLVVIEAEHFYTNEAGGGEQDFDISTDVGASNTYYMNAVNEGGTTTPPAASKLTYRTNITNSGTWYIWRRNRAYGALTDSVAWEYNSLGAETSDLAIRSGAWQWDVEEYGQTVPAGPGTLTLWRVDKRHEVDKIVMTQSGAYDPATVNGGLGPDESPRSIYIAPQSDHQPEKHSPDDHEPDPHSPV